MRTISGRSLVSVAVSLLCFFHQSAMPQPAPKQVYTFFHTAISARDSLPPTALGSWEFVGPINFSTGLVTAFGEDPVSLSGDAAPVSGRINGVAVSPSNPKIIYIAAASGGIWKSTDRGHTWAAMSASWPFQSVTAVAVDPTDPDIVYAGTGDSRRFDHVPPFGFGVFRSVNGGLSWLNSGDNQFGDQPVSRIVVDPSTPSIVTLTTGHGAPNRHGGIWRSIDSGRTWNPATPAVIPHATHPITIPLANWDDLEVCLDGTYWASASQADPSDPANGDGGIVFRSLDHGQTWLPTTIPALTVPGTAPPRSLDFSKSIAEAVHVACSMNQLGVAYVASIGTSPDKLGIFKTNDNGSHWVALTAPKDESLTCQVSNNLCSPWAHSQLTVSELGNEDIIYLGLVDIFRLQDGHWMVINTNDGKNLIHNDQNAAALDPSSRDQVFFATDGGLYLWNNRTGAFTSLNANLGITQIFRMDVHPYDARRLAAGSQDNGDEISLGRIHSGSAWAMILGGDGRSVAFDLNDPDFSYAIDTRGYFARYDWKVAGPKSSGRQSVAHPPGGGENPLVFADQLYGAISAAVAVAKYTDPAIEPTIFPLPIHVPSITALAVCGDGDAIYAGLDDGRLYRMASGAGWKNITSPPLPNLTVRAIDAGSGYCDDVIVGFGYDSAAARNDIISPGPYLFHTSDSTKAHVDWQPIATGGAHGIPLVPVNAVVRNPFGASGNTWFVGTEVGIFGTEDGGSTWTNAGGPRGLPNTLVRDVRIATFADAAYVYAATFGRGIWRAKLPPPNRPQNPCEEACRQDRDSCMSDVPSGHVRPQACAAELRHCLAQCRSH